MNPAQALHVRAVWLPDDTTRDIYIHGDRLTFTPIPGAQTVATGGYALPGLVDAHCHIGIKPGSIPIEDLDEAREFARIDRDAGVLAIRDAGSPYPYPELDDEPDLPRLVRAGRHLAPPRRYLRGIAVECTPEELPARAAEQAALGNGWVKLVADWIDRGEGDLGPTYDADVLAAAVQAAHAAGARVAVHTFSETAVAAVVRAGVDSVEHGTGLSRDLIDEMARRGTALVPTMINIATFDDIAAHADPKFPVYAAHMRRLKREFPEVVRAAHDAGVPIFVGTDAGGGIDHGLAAEEMLLLHEQAGMSAHEVLAAASWRAREWLGFGDRLGDLVVFDRDPRLDLRAVRTPSRIVLRGAVIR
ncbi:Pro-Hyp dipeptidase [Stackebrandtia albiflava]|uniref:Pro-Hyp dipeptidase n=1 Tax=Stackebrandtia albiflava TaxID=406432 RepID=A0A562VAD0_9ACTN|nr:amidohydrolase family protein [Stackebrandtia albiflava]TWJ14836.1 Pro-Hyp dipeptidase [Stackebrandtia albiflava]